MDEWYESVNVEALSEEARRAILEVVKNRLGFSKVCEALDIAKASLHKYLLGERKVVWRLMIKAMSREAARFIQFRFGELKISEARYEDLLSEADKAYPKYLQIVREVAEGDGNS